VAMMIVMDFLVRIVCPGLALRPQGKGSLQPPRPPS
jgi:hypothetical protein